MPQPNTTHPDSTIIVNEENKKYQSQHKFNTNEMLIKMLPEKANNGDTGYINLTNGKRRELHHL